MAYTTADLETLVAKFEQCCERQAANKNSTVKLTAAERDLLAVAESIRDLCIKAVKGNKDLLKQVWGGSCEHIGRIYQALDPVELSDMHAGDQRWKGCRNAVDALKQILEDLGSYKPFTMSKLYPENLEYPDVRKRFSPGVRVSLNPTWDGMSPHYFKVSPPLPENLRLNKMSGLISGQLKPGVELETQTYIVTAGNAHGEAKVELTFCVKVPPPEIVEYPDLTEFLYVCEPIRVMPTVEGGQVQEWSVKPALPLGLCLDEETGAISGMPLAAMQPMEYSIKASNTGGEAVVVVSIGAKVAPPISVSYVAADEQAINEDGENCYSCKAVVYFTPDVIFALSDSAAAGAGRRPRSESHMGRKSFAKHLPGMFFSVKPELPDGIEIAERTGVITGRPVKPKERTIYTVTVRNDGGEASVDLPLTIKLAPPEDLSYPDAIGKYYVGESVLLSPDVDGIVADWSIDTATLPAGLSFEVESGTIGGVPSEEATCSLTVTARNEMGETTTKLDLIVRRAPPSKLEYPALDAIYPVLRATTINPTVEGLVEEFVVAPNLPEGLTLDKETGIISGVPTKATDEATYDVFAKNESGVAAASIKFSIKVMPPEDLKYPSVDDIYYYGEDILLEPRVEGGATTWAVEPALPAGMILDFATGKISGAPSATAEQSSYVVTAFNDAGGTSVVLTFMVTAPAPEDLSYPGAEEDYTTGSVVLIEAELESGPCGTFTVEPSLPAGLKIDAKTGAISGSPSEAADSTSYIITVTNIAGSTTAQLTFSVSEIPDLAEATETFASMIERITDLVELRKMDPSKKRASGDWMLWMVHRAWLNDPELTIFDFDHLHMPLPHVEPRIAPKLVKAMAHNTQITQLHLNNTNMQKPQGHQLAQSLRKNKTLMILGIETNNLDSSAITEMALALKEFPESNLQQWRFNAQKCCGDHFGRPVEEALAHMLETNTKMLKLGVALNDPHWRRTCDKLLLRNNDAFRRQRKHMAGRKSICVVPEVKAENRTLSKFTLETPPDRAVWEIFADDDEKLSMVRTCITNAKKLPTKEQLQAFAKSTGKPLKFSEVALLLKDARAKLINAFVETQISATDVYESTIVGTLSAWTEINDKWFLDVWLDNDSRFAFACERLPAIEVSQKAAEWLSVKSD